MFLSVCASIPPQLNLDSDSKKKTALGPYHTAEIIAVEQLGSERQLPSLSIAIASLAHSWEIPTRQFQKKKKRAAAQLSALNAVK